MRYTIAMVGRAERAVIQSTPGRVLFNGESLLPHEAAMIGDALNACAESSETLAANLAGKLQPDALPDLCDAMRGGL